MFRLKVTTRFIVGSIVVIGLLAATPALMAQTPDRASESTVSSIPGTGLFQWLSRLLPETFKIARPDAQPFQAGDEGIAVPLGEGESAASAEPALGLLPKGDSGVDPNG